MFVAYFGLFFEREMENMSVGGAQIEVVIYNP